MRLCSSAGQFTFQTFRRKQRDFRTAHTWGGGIRTLLVTPLLREGTAIGLINIRRTELKPFTDKQVALLKPSPPRRSSPSRTCGCSRNCRNATRIARGVGASDGDDRGARIISRSPTDLQPVLDAIVESAARVCGTTRCYESARASYRCRGRILDRCLIAARRDQYR